MCCGIYTSLSGIGFCPASPSVRELVRDVWLESMQIASQKGFRNDLKLVQNVFEAWLTQIYRFKAKKKRQRVRRATRSLCWSTLCPLNLCQDRTYHPSQGPVLDHGTPCFLRRSPESSGSGPRPVWWDQEVFVPSDRLVRPYPCGGSSSCCTRPPDELGAIA